MDICMRTCAPLNDSNWTTPMRTEYGGLPTPMELASKIKAFFCSSYSSELILPELSTMAMMSVGLRPPCWPPLQKHTNNKSLFLFSTASGLFFNFFFKTKQNKNDKSRDRFFAITARSIAMGEPSALESSACPRRMCVECANGAESQA